LFLIPKEISMHKLVLVCAALGACHSSVVVGDLEEVTTMRAIPNRNLDILFVIDNSGSMGEQQAALAANFPRMIDVLEQLDGPLPNLHIGVTTSDVGMTSVTGMTGPDLGIGGQNGGCAGQGDNGALRTSTALGGAAFISDVELPDGTRDRNYTGALRDVFAEIAQVGAQGCGFEQHFSAMSRAFTNPANAGFLRADANLAVVIVADEDDCSVLDIAMLGPDSAAMGRLDSFRCTRYGVKCDPDDMLTPGVKADCAPRTIAPLVAEVQPFIDALVEIKGGDARAVMVAGIVGPPEPFEIGMQTLGGMSTLALLPSCTFAGPEIPETAFPAVRIAAFLDAFPGRSQLTSICDADLSVALSQIGDSTKKLVGDPCLDAPNLADASPDPGLQPACEVFDVRDSAPSTPTPFVACTGDAANCFEITADPIACPSAPGNLRVRIQRSVVPSADTWTHVRCQRAD
jgi:hypothetical protein